MKYTLICLISILGLSCSNKAVSSTPDSMANVLHTIPATYSKNKISVKGIINDSIPISLIFDTGAFGLAMHHNMKDELEITDSLKLSIGDMSRVLTKIELHFIKISHMMNSIEEVRKKDTYYGIVGWNFFGKQILELSEQDECIRILNSVGHLTDYEVVDCKEAPISKLLIAVPISIQGQLIIANLILDTGFNGMIMMSKDKMKNIDFSRAKGATATGVTMEKQNDLSVLVADSIQIGNSSLKDVNIAILSSIPSSATTDGVLGMEFFKKYSVVIDFRASKLYLKARS